MIQCILSSRWTGYMLGKFGMTFLRLALLKSPAMMHAASGCLLMLPLSSSWSLDRAKLVSAWGNVDGSNDDRCKLPGQVEWAADNGEVFQMRRAGTRQNGDIPGVTPFLVNHEAHSTHLWFFRPRLFCPSVKQKSYQTALQRVRDRRREPRFGQTKDVTVSNVPLETYPGSKIVHLILQGSDIGEQNTR